MLLFKEKCFELKDLNMLELKGSLWSIWPLCFFFFFFWVAPCFCLSHARARVCMCKTSHAQCQIQFTQVHSSMVAGRCQECANKGWEKQDCQLIDVHVNGCWFLSFICAVVAWGVCLLAVLYMKQALLYALLANWPLMWLCFYYLEHSFPKCRLCVEVLFMSAYAKLQRNNMILK